VRPSACLAAVRATASCRFCLPWTLSYDSYTHIYDERVARGWTTPTAALPACSTVDAVSADLHSDAATVPRDPVSASEAYGPEGRSAWLDIDWQRQQRWLVIDGQPVNTIELGPEGAPADADVKQPLVFVHGLSGSWPNWLEQLPAFAAERRVVTLDLPGFGYSPMPDEQISIAGYARLLDRLLGELGIDAAAVVGNSMGGFIGAELAIAFPQRVERLVLVSAAGISTTSQAQPRTARVVPALRRLETVLAASGAWVASKSDTVARRPRLRRALLNIVTRHPDRLPAPLAAEQLRGAGKPGFLQGLQAVLDYDISERLPEIACPTLIVWGDRDRLITVRDADVFAELIPDSRKVIFKDTGHMSMLERPAAFNALLRDFLADRIR
jgi:pimeloyl-ACP methyl ester carboxylesterase